MSRSIIIRNNTVSEVRDGKNKNANKSPNNNHQNNKRKIKRRYKFLIFLFILMLFALGTLKYAEARLRPIIKSMALAQAQSIGARAISEAINEEIEATDISYNDLISFEKDTNGNIAALKTNIISVNRLKSRLSVVILDKLSNIDSINLYIPVGNLINGEFLSGRGPKIELRLLPVGAVATDISNVFMSAGINQTQHQIMLDVQALITIILPFSSETADISSSICIAETVIIGDVPNTFFQAGE